MGFQFKSFQVNQQLFNVLASMLKNKSNVTMAGSHLKSIAINQNLQIPQELLHLNDSSLVNNSICCCCDWRENSGHVIFEAIYSRMDQKNIFGKKESVENIENSSENGANNKKRKYSGRIEIEIDFLLSQDGEALTSLKPRLSGISDHLQL